MLWREVRNFGAMIVPSQRGTPPVTPRGRLAALCAGVLGLAAYALPGWLAAPAQTVPASAHSYVDARVCATCHRQIWETYRQTGMGRSFYRPSAGTTVPATYYHKA